MKKKLAILSTVAVCLFGAISPSYAAEQMDNGVWVDAYRAGNSRSGRMAVLFSASNDNGMLAICGNYYMWGGASVHRKLRRALRNYRFFYNGQALFSDASFLWEAPSEDRIGEQVTCRTSSVPFVANANDLLNGRMPFSR